MPSPGNILLPPDARELLEPLLLEDGQGRAVAFDADGTLWRGDVGDDFLRLIASDQRYPALVGRRGVYAEYERRVERDPAEGYAFAVEVMEGAPEQVVADDAVRFFESRFAGRIFKDARALVTLFSSRGYDVWVVSASPLWTVRAGALALGIPADRVIGVCCPVEQGTLRLPVTTPVPCFEGKVHQLEARGVRPVLAVGNGELDLPMLAYAERALVIAPHGDRGNALVHEASRRRWPVLRC